MKLIGLKLKNFRRYQNISFDLSKNLHMIVGMNDIGKSTIFDALDIFFNGNNAFSKLSLQDLNHDAFLANDKIIKITCIFSIDKNEKVIIDSQYEVNPKDEYLLNKDGNIEILKEYNCEVKTIKPKIYLKSYLPNCINVDILTKKQTELKNLLDSLCPNSVADRRINSEMRLAIYSHLINENPNSIFEEKLIDTSSILNDKDFYTNLEKSMPDFYLFKADRENNTSDSEIQNPLAIAVKDVLSSDEIKGKLREIQTIVENRVNEVNQATIEQMQKFSSRIGSSLKANISTNWQKAISNDINDANDIPINKKGSGIRRLLLLSYLMVDAQKRTSINNKKNIVYAIEEPETALHPKLQVKFISELYRMANKHTYETGDEIPTNGNELNTYKILLTTHTPNYLAYATQKEVIYLSEDDNGNILEIDGDLELKQIRDEMGLLPNPNYGFIIFVEGDSDISFLKNVGQIPELKSIFDLSNKKVDIISLNGSNLLNSIEKNFYKDLPVKQFHLYDGDRQEYKDFLQNKVNGKNIKWFGTTTLRKEIEYYIPPQLIETTLGIDLSDVYNRYTDTNFDLISHILNLNSTILLGIKSDKHPEASLKAFLNKRVMKGVTKEHLISMGVYDEIKGWFEKMKELDNIISE